MSGGFSNKRSDFNELTAAEELWVQTGSAGVVLFDEQASAPSLTAGKGKLYVKTSDSNLYFLDEDGVESQITGAGAGVSVEIPAGAVTGANTSYTVSAEPKWVIGDGIIYFDGAGYSYAALTITMDIPPSYAIRAII